ncbi:TetR/AcrR family transcriptional regulator [Aquipuribacter nitratireducens]|uniref:TetR/AcrR family transcriptional regulator n=1 Tax=Aquipuribacter nitratireducens TaxID=650104 RepID=A0ABW0GRT1_9MICO
MSGTDGVRQRGRPARHSLDELVQIVAEEFIERGYDATSMEDLARATGLTKAALYHHVPGKEQFLRLAVARGVDALEAAFDEAEQQPRPAIEQLETVVRRSVDVLVDNLPYVTLLLRVRGNTETEQWALARRRDLDARAAALTSKAAADGDLDPEIDARLVTRLVFGAVNSLTEWYRPDGQTPPQAVADVLSRMLVEGLRPRP